jgi:hypothetical protein
MALHLSDHLSAARQRLFVGRGDELALFEGALAAAELPFRQVYLYGVGGVGKTTLLSEFARRCLSAGTPLIALDGHTIEPSHAALLTALRHAMKLAPSGSPLEVLAARTDRFVLVIDSYEVLAPLDTWIREAFLPHLPSTALVVLADRRPPAPAWRADAGWASLVQTVSLSNLSPQESLAYLARRGVPGAQQQAAITFTCGHPLALALVADVIGQQPDVPIQPEAIPDVLQTLLKRFCDQVPDAAHRSALEVCALAHVMTEDLLAEMLALPDAFELVVWLRRLSFIESGPLGLFPHDLAREILAADLRWRSPDSFAQLSRRAASYYIAHLQHARDWEQERLLFEFLFLHRHSPAIRPLFTPAERTEHGGVVTDLEALWGDNGPFVGIKRVKLHSVLRSAAAAVPVRLGLTVETLVQQDTHVSVSFNDGSTGTYDLVVGADGVTSRVRALTLSMAPPVDGRQMVWRSIAPTRPHGLATLQFHLGDGCFFGLCPVDGGQTYGFANVTVAPFHEPVQGRLERLRQRFAGFGSVVQEYLAGLDSDEQIHCSSITWLEQAEWYAGRAVLIGDAAHASSPMMGQGGCLAMEDA